MVLWSRRKAASNSVGAGDGRRGVREVGNPVLESENRGTFIVRASPRRGHDCIRVVGAVDRDLAGERIATRCRRLGRGRGMAVRGVHKGHRRDAGRSVRVVRTIHPVSSETTSEEVLGQGGRYMMRWRSICLFSIRQSRKENKPNCTRGSKVVREEGGKKKGEEERWAAERGRGRVFQLRWGDQADWDIALQLRVWVMDSRLVN
jgi:hypothetical protein